MSVTDSTAETNVQFAVVVSFVQSGFVCSYFVFKYCVTCLVM